jgi:hypothetical protein
MAYTINLTNGTVFATVADGTTNTDSSVTLVGKNYAGYGEFLDENFIQMLENFSSASSGGNPTNSKLAAPLIGQLWWDSTNGLLKAYTGTGWKIPTGSTASSSTPTVSVKTGDLWFDTTNQQLKVYNGSSFIVAGPAFSSSQGTSGAIPLSINDTGGTPHVVTGIYAANTLVAITSPDTTFVPQAPFATNFPQIFQGTTVYNTGVMSGNIASNTAITVTSSGSTILNISSTALSVAGLVSASGNVTGANLLTTGLVTATGNVIGGNLVTAGAVSAGGLVSAAGNITGGNVLTAGLISATGNVTGGNIIATTRVSGTSLSVSGNVDGGNLRTGGLITATGNITVGNVITAIVSASGNVSAAGNIIVASGKYFLGDGGLLTNVSAAVSVTKIENGTSKAEINSTGGNLAVTIGGTANVLIVSNNNAFLPNLTVTNNIFTTSNGTGNIGSAANTFNTIFAKATTAQYADVAERFAADEILAPGTVVELGGIKEITKVKADLSEKVFGVISTRAAYLMNGMAGSDDTHPPVAMTGRVPVVVTGAVHKGDRLVSAGNGIARAARPGEATAFNVIGRALVDKHNDDLGTIEAIVTIK